MCFNPLLLLLLFCSKYPAFGQCEPIPFHLRVLLRWSWPLLHSRVTVLEAHVCIPAPHTKVIHLPSRPRFDFMQSST